MSVPRKEIPVALRPQLRHDYEKTGESVESLANRAGLCKRTFQKCAKELGWTPARVDKRGRRLMMWDERVAPPVISEEAFAAAARAMPDKREPADRSVLARRIRLAVQHELTAIEITRATINPAETGRTESVMRVLSGLTRALQDALRLEGALTQSGTIDSNALPGNLDELRRTLLDRVEALAAEHESEIYRRS